MIDFVQTPHLPKGNVRHLIIGKKYEKLLKNASVRYGFELICLESNPCCDKRLSGHADLAAVHIGGNRMVCRKFVKGSAAHSIMIELGASVDFVDDCISPIYPHEASLNFCIVGSKVILNPKTADAIIVEKLTNDRACCKQGYTKCSVCVVDDNSIITEDEGVARCAVTAGMNVLKIPYAGIMLDGFDKGFIGGASFKLAPDIMAFTGTLKNEIAKNKIEEFLQERSISAVYLNDAPAIDIGSAIPISEEM